MTEEEFSNIFIRPLYEDKFLLSEIDKNIYDEVIDLTKKDGLIIIDNVLWHGEVADRNNNDTLTKTIRDFNNYVKNDKKTEQVIIPIGDGLTVCRKL